MLPTSALNWFPGGFIRRFLNVHAGEGLRVVLAFSSKRSGRRLV